MSFHKRKGYRIERKIRIEFEKRGWRVIRAGGSFGEADLICIKRKKCLFLQVKSTRKKTLYYYGRKVDQIEGFPFYLIVDFGYGKIIVTKPKKIVGLKGGIPLKTFFKKINSI